ncbi:hypothetical protein VE03_10285, partial [Pseudogymnoascus sp. 23342-1-I1]
MSHISVEEYQYWGATLELPGRQDPPATSILAMFSGLRITSRDKTKDGLRAPDNKGKEGTENKFEVRTP